MEASRSRYASIISALRFAVAGKNAHGTTKCDSVRHSGQERALSADAPAARHVRMHSIQTAWLHEGMMPKSRGACIGSRHMPHCICEHAAASAAVGLIPLGAAGAASAAGDWATIALGEAAFPTASAYEGFWVVAEAVASAVDAAVAVAEAEAEAVATAEAEAVAAAAVVAVSVAQALAVATVAVTAGKAECRTSAGP